MFVSVTESIKITSYKHYRRHEVPAGVTLTAGLVGTHVLLFTIAHVVPPRVLTRLRYTNNKNLSVCLYTSRLGRLASIIRHKKKMKSKE